MKGWDMGEGDPLEASLARVREGRNPERRDLGNASNDAPEIAIDPRVTAILDRLHDKVFDATREAVEACADLSAADPSLGLPPQRMRPR